MIAKGKEVKEKGQDDEAIIFMKEIFPKMKEKYGSELNEIWFIQRPGDLVFIPGGWWHSVVNLDDTIAITQNYCNTVNFPKIWRIVRKERKKMAVKLLRKLKERRKDLYDIAVRINLEDGFLMYDEIRKMEKEGKIVCRKDLFKDTDSDSDSSSSSLNSDSSSDEEGNFERKNKN